MHWRPVLSFIAGISPNTSVTVQDNKYFQHHPCLTPLSLGSLTWMEYSRCRDVNVVVGGYFPLPIFRFAKCQNLVLSLRNRQKKMLLPSVRTYYFIRDLDERGSCGSRREWLLFYGPFSAINTRDSSSWPQGLARLVLLCLEYSERFRAMGDGPGSLPLWTSEPWQLKQSPRGRQHPPKIIVNLNFHLGLRVD